MIASVTGPVPPRWGLARLIGAHICLHACMAGLRMAAPLLALKQGYSALAVGVLMPMLFGSIGAVVGVSVVFWAVGAVVGLGSRVAWKLRAPALSHAA